MTPPRFVDQDGRPRAPRPCHRRGRPTPVGDSYRLEHLRMIAWQLFAEAGYVASCEHLQYVLLPHIDAEMGHLAPILGEAL